MSDAELQGIIDDIERGFDGDAWHGPSLLEVLDGVTFATASARPIPGGHSIREIVVHLAAWDDVVVRRIAERRDIELPDGGNFPPVVGTGPPAWEDDLGRLQARHAELLRTISSLDPARLGEPVAGKTYPIAHMIRGIAQHMAYHAGQIALIKKLSGS